MSVNNVCKMLIVYGSYVPGAENHRVFSGLPGEWKKGKILCDLMDPPDGIGPGDNQEVEAWTIEFSDCQAELFTPEYETQKRLLYERWTALDRAMGQSWGRDQWRWWPEDSDPVVGKNGMIVVNIYVPLKNFPYLLDQDDVPSPDEEDDLHGLWNQVKSIWHVGSCRTGTLRTSISNRCMAFGKPEVSTKLPGTRAMSIADLQKPERTIVCRLTQRAAVSSDSR